MSRCLLTKCRDRHSATLSTTTRGPFGAPSGGAVLVPHRKEVMFQETGASAPSTYPTFANAASRDVVHVPLSPAGRGTATVYRDDYERLMAMGVGKRWFLVKNGGGQSYVRAYLRTATGRQITVARLILDAGRGEVVNYRKGDRTDLRSDMIFAERGYAKRDDAGLLREFRASEAEAVQFDAV